MLSNLLTNVADKTRTVSISEAALYAILGYAIVFLGIAFLILVVWLVGRLMTKKGNAPKTEKKVESIKETAQAAAPIAGETEEISEETVAVITAAIMAYYQQTKPKCEFTVKRIKRI